MNSMYIFTCFLLCFMRNDFVVSMKLLSWIGLGGHTQLSLTQIIDYVNKNEDKVGWVTGMSNSDMMKACKENGAFDHKECTLQKAEYLSIKIAVDEKPVTKNIDSIKCMQQVIKTDKHGVKDAVYCGPSTCLVNVHGSINKVPFGNVYYDSLKPRYKARENAKGPTLFDLINSDKSNG